MLIMDHGFQSQAKFEGQFKVVKSVRRLNRYSDAYLVLDIMDVSGTIRAYGWSGRYNGTQLVKPNDFITLQGEVNTFRQVDAFAAEFVDDRDLSLSWLLSSVDFHNQDLLMQFARTVDEIKTLPMKDFIRSVFRDSDLIFTFMHNPASVNHHHSDRSGLLEHSLECAEVVKMTPGLSLIEREVGIVAALLHDVGKTRTNTERGLSPTGFWVHHNCLTLELLSPALAQLDKRWPTAADMLRHIWSSLHKGSTQSRSSLASLVKYADQFSAEREREKAAFNGQESWKTWQKDPQGNPHLRMRMPQKRQNVC